MENAATSLTPPNVVVFTCHDLGRFLGCYDVPTARTPNLDRLAAEGIRFSQAFCTAPQCSPSRASIFTGRYPHSNGVMGLTQAFFGWDLNPDERHLAQVLREHGYTTALVGHHHESARGEPAEVMARCGYEHYVQPHRGEDVSATARDHLEKLAADDRPFYLQVGYIEPHRLGYRTTPEPAHSGFTSNYIEPDSALGVTVPPYLVDEPSAREELAELQGAVHYLDAAVGQVLDQIDRLGLRENTLVLFTTDHGLAFPRAKCSLFDAGLEVALIMRLPSRRWVGDRVVDALVSNVDLFPTVLDAVGIPVPDNVQGRGLERLLTGEATEHRDRIFGEMTFHTYYDPRRCVRTRTHKLIVNFTTTLDFMDSADSWRPRVTPVGQVFAFHKTVELYDLATDPVELNNVADDPAYRAVRDELLGVLRRHLEETSDPLLRGPVLSPMHTWATTALGL